MATVPSDAPLIVKGRAPALAAYPHARRAGDFVFVSGVSSRRPDGTHDGVELQRNAEGEVVATHKDIAAQTEAVLRNIDAILQAAGGTLKDVVDIAVFLVDMGDYAGMNAVYNRHFNAETGPSRTTVAVAALPHPNLLVEMKAVAYLPQIS